MTQLSAGKEVSCYCNKCQLTLAHTIVVMKNDKVPSKVQCNTCKSSHAFKDGPTKTPKAKVKVKTIKSGRTGKNGVQIPLAEHWEKSVNKAKNPSRPYTIKTNFLVGDLLDHPTFGTGIVERILDKTKMEVIFKDNIRTLMHSL